MAGVATSPVELGLAGVRMTRADYDALPEGHPRAELIWGELWVAAAPSTRHQDVLFNLAMALRLWCDRVGGYHVMLAPTDVELGPDSVIQPDILVLDSAHSDFGREVDRISSPPLLVVEVLSPTTEVHDRKRKFFLCEEAGVRYLWLVDPKRLTMQAYELRNGRYAEGVSVVEDAAVFCAPPFARLEIDPKQVFRRVV